MTNPSDTTPTPLRERQIFDALVKLADDVWHGRTTDIRERVGEILDTVEKAALSARDAAGAVASVAAEMLKRADCLPGGCDWAFVVEEDLRRWAALLATPPASGEAGAVDASECPRCEGEYPDSCWYCTRESATPPAASGDDAAWVLELIDRLKGYAVNFPTFTLDDAGKVDEARDLIARRLAAVAPAGMDADAHNVAVKILTALGHEPKVADRCTAFVPQLPPEKRLPGPASPPIFCCLKAGHEGPHKCNYGGISWPAPFRESDPVEFREQPRLCAKCRTTWPCPDAKAALAAAAPTPPATAGEEGA